MHKVNKILNCDLELIFVVMLRRILNFRLWLWGGGGGSGET